MATEIVTITPAPSIDWTVRVNSFELDAVNRIVESSREAAGKGLNVARAVRRATFPARAIFPAGGASGRFMIAELDQAKVAHDVVDTGQDVRTNITLLSPGSSTKINEPGTPLSHDDLVALVAKSVEACRNAALLMLCGTLPENVPALFVTRLIEAIQAQGRPVWVDSSGECLATAVQAGPELIKPNAHELAELTGRPLRTLGEVAEAARSVLPAKAGAEALVSLGGDGALLVSADQILQATALNVPVVNTVGAGDALLAGFAAATVAGRSDAERLRQAVAWASSAVASPTTAFNVDPTAADSVHVQELTTPETPLREPATP